MRSAIMNFSKIIIGVLIGAFGFHLFGPEKIKTVIETETIVEKIEIPVIETKTIVKEIKIPEIVEKVIIKEVEVPKIIERPVIQKINSTRVIYRPIKERDLHDLKPLVKEEELYCMALNIYREANNQSVAGQIAVGRVVMNRVLDRRYPADTCGVIYEGPVRESWQTAKNPDLKPEERIYYPKRDRCQFSWYCDGKKDELINKENNRAWKTAENIAFQILAFDKWNGVMEGATHYHADYVNPKWMHTLQRITKIDDHIFYKRN